eukprot:TRINITY_DN1164_c0_g1_i2.p1 TRINITY_DN1164_c0_g1~~TRINITY_DN1164_c0_g1_i2.p1  ORF type:complete len:333 (+),score=72.29 TRINITY_DN1164_c0_g1_i2:115-1113(+)
MKIKVNVEWHSKQFSIDVLPSDTVWALKWKIFDNNDVKEHYEGSHPPSPDDQQLHDEQEDMVLDDCERSLESYSIHEGSELSCEKRDLYLSFHALLNGFRKKKSHLPLTGFTPFPLVKHGSMHMHEVRSIQLQLGRGQSHHTKSLVHYVIHSIQSLKELDISTHRGKIEKEELVSIAENFVTNTSMKMLNLCYCEIGSVGAAILSEILEKNSSLETLDLSGNSGIGDEGCIRIADAMIMNTSLKSLILHQCGIGSVGATRIGQMLETNSSLETLDLDYSWGIGNEGCLRIAEALEINASLKVLILSGMSIISFIRFICFYFFMVHTNNISHV